MYVKTGLAKKDRGCGLTTDSTPIARSTAVRTAETGALLTPPADETPPVPCSKT